MRALGYARVSTDEQVQSGVSLDLQAARIREFADANSIGLVEIVTDPGYSGSSLDRPGIRNVLARVASGEIREVVVFKLDRLTRSLRDWTAMLDDHFARGCSLRSVSDGVDLATPGGRFYLNLQFAMSQWELETITDRTSKAMVKKRESGHRLGQIPFGWRLGADGKTLEPDPAESATLATITQLSGQGMNTRCIADELNARGIPAKRGGTWSHSSVGALLRRSSGANA